MRQKPQVIAKLLSLPRIITPRGAIRGLPDSPGIYLFYNAEKELIYVGKASSLNSRVKSYFHSLPSISPLGSRRERDPVVAVRRDPAEAVAVAGQGGTSLSRPIEGMIHEVAQIDWKQTDSVLEAIILEANYIKKFQPKYNVLGKDDRSWNYLVITKDKFSKVETIRQHEYAIGLHPEKEFAYVFGPYPGLNTAAAMKLLRKFFRFSNCLPPPPTPSSGRRGQQPRPCLYYQLGQCPGICTGEITAPEYKQKVIRPLVMFLRGKKKQVIRLLEKQMKIAGSSEHYEEAARLRDQLKALYRIQDVALLNKSFFKNSVIARLPQATEAISWIKKSSSQGDRHVVAPMRIGAPPRDDTFGLRVEGYDISNLGATDKVGSMVVFDEIGPVKSAYRKFTIKRVFGQSDVDCLAEVMERRFNHHEWPRPQIILVDGGRPQVNKVSQVLRARKVGIPVVGIAKGPSRKKNEFILGSKNPQFIAWVNNHQQLLIQARDEAHRFAISFSRSKRKIKR